MIIDADRIGEREVLPLGQVIEGLVGRRERKIGGAAGDTGVLVDRLRGQQRQQGGVVEREAGGGSAGDDSGRRRGETGIAQIGVGESRVQRCRVRGG